MKVEKHEQMKPKVSRRKVIIQIIAEINKIKIRKIEKKPRNQKVTFENINKIAKCK